jgi:hypothetical protein
MKISKIFFFLLFINLNFSIKATNYYVNAAIGKDSNKGISPAIELNETGKQ